LICKDIARSCGHVCHNMCIYIHPHIDSIIIYILSKNYCNNENNYSSHTCSNDTLWKWLSEWYKWLLPIEEFRQDGVGWWNSALLSGWAS
jgi:hypothetical protein